jgi:hypothetical protein
MAPFFERAFRYLRQQRAPIRLETGASLVEAGCGAGAVLTGMQARVEAAAPLPRVDVDRNASALSDVPDADVTEIDLPGLSVRVV